MGIDEDVAIGIDIYAFPERLVDGRHVADIDDRFFNWRQHEVWAFLGGRRSKVGVPPLAEERGIPADGLHVDLLDELDGGSWLSVRELPDFDYGTRGRTCRRISARSRRMSGGARSRLPAVKRSDRWYDTTFVGTFRITEEFGDHAFGDVEDPEAATEVTVRRFLGPGFFDELARLAGSGADRIVFFYG